MFTTRLKVWLAHFATKYVILFIIALLLFFPEAGKNYEGFFDGFVLGGFHGALAIPNKIISMFDNRLVMAESASTLYMVAWWFSLISNFIDDVYRIYKSFWGSLLD